MASWGRAHAIKAALLVGFILVLLNLFSYRFDIKLEKTLPLQGSHSSTLWPKRTRTSTEVINITIGNASIAPTNNNLIITSNLSLSNSTPITQFPLDNLISIPSSQILSLNESGNLLQANASLNESSQQQNSKNSPVDISKIETSTNFMQTIMTTLGLNACPPIPPDLDGAFEVDKNEEPLKNVELKLGPQLELGGWYHPTECNAKDRVAIIVPYRDRAQHLPIFFKNLHPMLMKQQINYGIFIVEQIAGTQFNRAALMNVGYVEASKLSTWDCFIFHDVDLLPMDDRNLYTCPDQPRHMSVAVDTFNFKLPYSTIFGGVSAMTTKQFQTVNGFSNSFWGWGGEDDDMSNRLKHAGYHIARYPINIARYTMLSHKKEKANPKRYEKLVSGAKRFDSDGLNSLKYKLQSVKKFPLYTWFLVDLHQETSS